MPRLGFVPCLALALLAACTAGGKQHIAPFADRPDETFAFRYTIQTVTGTVWGFSSDGGYVDFGGPVGLIHENTRASAITISGTKIDLQTRDDVREQNPNDIKALIEAAKIYCTASGHTLYDERGARVYTRSGYLHLVDFCGPNFERQSS